MADIIANAIRAALGPYATGYKREIKVASKAIRADLRALGNPESYECPRCKRAVGTACWDGRDMICTERMSIANHKLREALK